ncbi:unnamed protein product [Sphagnum balticum]
MRDRLLPAQDPQQRTRQLVFKKRTSECSTNSSRPMTTVLFLLVHGVQKKEISLTFGSGANADTRWRADSEAGQGGGGRERAWKTKAAAAAAAVAR